MNEWALVFVVLLLVSAITFSILLGSKSSKVDLPTVTLTRVDTVDNGNAFQSYEYSFTLNTTNADSVFGSYDINQVGTVAAPTLSLYTTSLTFNAAGKSGDPGETYSIYVTAENANGASVASYTLSVTCFMEDVMIQTSRGGIQAQNLLVGDLLLQPDGEYKRIEEVQVTQVNDSCKLMDRRIYADLSERIKVTHWHKLMWPGEEMVYAGESAHMHEIFPQMPFTVYHFRLEEPTDHILVEGTDAILESLKD